MPSATHDPNLGTRDATHSLAQIVRVEIASRIGKDDDELVRTCLGNAPQLFRMTHASLYELTLHKQVYL